MINVRCLNPRRKTSPTRAQLIIEQLEFRSMLATVWSPFVAGGDPTNFHLDVNWSDGAPNAIEDAILSSAATPANSTPALSQNGASKTLTVHAGDFQIRLAGNTLTTGGETVIGPNGAFEASLTVSGTGAANDPSKWNAQKIEVGSGELAGLTLEKGVTVITQGQPVTVGAGQKPGSFVISDAALDQSGALPFGGPNANRTFGLVHGNALIRGSEVVSDDVVLSSLGFGPTQTVVEASAAGGSEWRISDDLTMGQTKFLATLTIATTAPNGPDVVVQVGDDAEFSSDAQDALTPTTLAVINPGARLEVSDMLTFKSLSAGVVAVAIQNGGAIESERAIVASTGNAVVNVDDGSVFDVWNKLLVGGSFDSHGIISVSSGSLSAAEVELGGVGPLGVAEAARGELVISDWV